MFRSTLIDMNPVEFKYYLFMISLSKCTGSYIMISLSKCTGSCIISYLQKHVFQKTQKT